MEGRWEPIGGHPGGTVSALANTGNGSRTLFAATPVGVYTSEDSGSTWSSAGVGSTGAFVEAVLPSPSFDADRTVFAGGRNGLYRSRDSGASWSRKLSTDNITAIAISPEYRHDGTLLVSTETAGILRSVDGGETWEWANLGLLELRVLALSLSCDFAVDGVGFAATATGLYRTRNAGETWQQVWPNRGEAAVQCLAMCSPLNKVVLAGTEEHGLLRSVDGGNTWEQTAILADHSVMAAACSRSGILAATTEDSVAISIDAGENWRLQARTPGPVLSLCFVSHERGEMLIAGLPSLGVARSEDYGGSWTLEPIGLYGKLPGGLALSPAFSQDQTLYCFGPDDGVIVSRNGNGSWTEVGPGGSVAGFALSSNFPSDGKMYCATDSGFYISVNRSGNWRRLTERAATAVKVEGQVALAALEGGEVLASEDRGETWSSFPSISSEAKVTALEVSHGHIFAATEGSGQQPNQHTVWRFSSAGGGWERWLDEPCNDTLVIAAPSAGTDLGVVFVGLNGDVLTCDDNLHQISGGVQMPAWRRTEIGNVSLMALAVSPAFGEDDTLFAATSESVYVSKDAGTSFTPLRNHQVLSPIVSLAPTPDYSNDRRLYGVALGGAIWQYTD